MVLHKKRNPCQRRHCFLYGNKGLNIAGRILEIKVNRRFEHPHQNKTFPIRCHEKNNLFTTMDGSACQSIRRRLINHNDYKKFLVMLLNKSKYKTRSNIKRRMQLSKRMQVQKQAGTNKIFLL
jgi:hypothetical protein